MRTCSLFFTQALAMTHRSSNSRQMPCFQIKNHDRRKRRYLCPVFWGIMYRYVFSRSESGLIFYWKQQALPLRQPCAVRPCAFSQRGDFLRGLTVCEKHRTGHETYSIFFEEIPAKKMWDVPVAVPSAVRGVNSCSNQ
jgi:hypothetical protein